MGKREIVTVYTAGHAFRIDVTATVAEGLLDETQVETAGDAMRQVEQNFKDEIVCIDAERRQVLVTSREIHAIAYERI